MLEEFQVEVTNCSDVPFLDADRTSTPAWLIRLTCTAHAAAASLAEGRDLCEWFGVSRTRAAIHHWYQSMPTTTTRTSPPTQIVSLSTRSRSSSLRRKRCGSTPLSTSIQKSCVKHDFLRTVGQNLPPRLNAVFLVDGMGYLTALAKTDLFGDLNYLERNIVEKLFQTYTMRIGRFHETWNGSQPALGAWLTAYYNHLRSHQALENQPPVEALEQQGSI